MNDGSSKREILFNIPIVLGSEEATVARTIELRKLEGNGEYSKRCAAILKEQVGCARAIMTPSCTAALEMCAILCDIEPGDQVIMPSYSFVSAALPFVARGAEIVWCDIRADTKNLDETLLEDLITERTRAVVVVHYGGVACEMDTICEICRRRGVRLVEDAAQAVGCSYRDRPVGSSGDLATLSFHATKNVQCGEGGALLVNNPAFVERAEIIRDKGTDRSRFLKGFVDKYTWVDVGSSFLMSELQAAFLSEQLSAMQAINERRMALWTRYLNSLLKVLPSTMLPSIPSHCVHNGHVFPLINEGLDARQSMARYLKERGIAAYFHFVPLHLAPYWKGRYDGLFLPVTDGVYDGLLRLPLYYDLEVAEVDEICECIEKFAVGEGLVGGD